MLYCGEHIGDGAADPKVDIAVDPLDGTTLISQARAPARPPPSASRHACAVHAPSRDACSWARSLRT